MATTPNYGWVTPAPTDFVTDLPADFETFADAADATVKALNPGTTAGDLDYYTSGTAKARLAIGTAGQVLTVNSGATAPEWAAASSGGLTLLSTTTLSGSSVDVSSIDQSYKTLVFEIYGITITTGDAEVKFQFLNNTTALNQKLSGTTDVSGSLQTYNSTSPFNPTPGTIHRTTDTVLNSHLITVVNYSTSDAKPITYEGGQPFGTYIYSGIINRTSTIDKFNVSCSASTFSGGTIKIYGAN